MTAVDHDHAARLVTHLSQQRASGKYCDVCVCVAEQRFLAHKCVLSANSDQLDALILDATDEDNTSHDIEIEIHGVSPVGFEIVLEYFYTGVLRLEPSTVTHTWMTAVYLGLPDIISRCNSYCQQSACVTAHPKVSQFPAIAAPSQASGLATGNSGPAQMTTSTMVSSVTNQPKVNSMVKPKQSARTIINTTKAARPQPFEIRENPGNNSQIVKDVANENSNKKARFSSIEEVDSSLQAENAVAWNTPYGQLATPTVPTGVTLPVTSMPQVVVNLVPGVQPITYQTVEQNPWVGTPQQWAQVQVGKGQFVTAGVIPVAQQQVKHEPVLTPAIAVQMVGGESTNTGNAAGGDSNTGKNSPVSYTTLSLVSQDLPNQSESRNEGESTAETPSPVSARAPVAERQSNSTLAATLPTSGATPRRAVMQTQELNLDNIHFTQINTDDAQQQRLTSTPANTSSNVQTVTMINNINWSNSSGDDARCDTGTIMMQSEVEQLRIQHQQLQRLQQLESKNGGGEPQILVDTAKAILSTSKRKRKAPTRVSKSEDRGAGGSTHELHAHSNVRKSRSLAESVLVTITPGHMEYLYQKYPEIKKETPVTGTCDVMQLLQHGKARQRKSSEQNALNNTIRSILDATGIVESGDSRVQDAVCLIMDRFTVLQDHMNDAYVRKQLSIKVKHSIHCKKWRLKRHKMKLELSSASSPDTQPSWATDPNNSNISINSNNSGLIDGTDHAQTSWVADPNSSIISMTDNSMLAEESLHS